MFLKNLYKKYIENTPEKAIVANRKICLCGLTKAVTTGLYIDHSIKNVYVTTRCLKHLFDKKPAEEFLFIIDNLHKVVKHPDKIYKNRKGKRGEFCFVKNIGNEEYFCSIEIIKIQPFVRGVSEFGLSERGISSITKEIHIVTVFRLRDPKYTKNYTLLWNWGNGNPHRSALDTSEEVY